jgi:hypothetical protein
MCGFSSHPLFIENTSLLVTHDSRIVDVADRLVEEDGKLTNNSVLSVAAYLSVAA